MKVAKSRELEEAVYKWYVNERGLEIADAANKLARRMGIESFKASDGWLWRFRNRHGIGNKVEHGESGSAVEPLGLKSTRLKKTENLHLGQLYNTDETALFWRSLQRNTQAF